MKTNLLSRLMSDQLVNLDYLIESSLNDEEYVRMMIEMYIKNTPAYLESFNKHVQNNDFEELKKAAHKFKASVAIIGIEKAKELIQELENISDTNHEKANELISQIEVYCSESVIYLKAKLDSTDNFCD